MQADDLERVLTWRNRPEVADFMFTDHQISEAEHARWFDAVMVDDTRRYWIIEFDGEPVGLANLYDISRLHKRAYLGLYLADDRVRGKGVGAATDRFLMTYAFEDLGLDKLCAEVLATNEAGIRVHQHQGFQIDGVLRGHVLKADRRLDVVTMSVLHDDPPARENARERA
jgi:UDP-4-amino-4,6-dideoxy-N-acetyl-beta-L-altrosamine N-acetyltransferase